ncbi:MAG TPA: PAS domain S-box protein [Thermoanaerobaculia bacterium]|nr:PAS domain S-box protein [Thermoanaerobaculia bacterium]
MKRKGAARRGRGRSGDAAPLLRTPFSESYREVMELAPIGIFTSTLEGRFLAANAALVEMLGYESVEEVLGIDIPGDLYFDPDERARVLSQYEQGSGIVRVETVLKRKDGSPVSIRFDSRVVRDAEGRTLGFEGFAHDITEGKRAEEELRRSEERFRALVENSSEVIGLFDREGHWLYASPSVERLWGYSAEEMKPFRRFGERAHPDDVEALREKFRGLVGRPDGMETMEFRGRHKDGSWRVFEAVGVNRLETPGVGAIVANLRDITARKEAEIALKESEERFRTLIDRAPVAIGIGRNGRTIYANEKYQEMYGFRSIDELRDRPIAEQWAPQSRPEIEERVRQCGLGLLVATEYEGVGQRKDGSQFPVVAAATVVQLADGPATIAFLADITERKRAEEQRASILERVSDGFVALDTDWRYTYLNTKAAQIFGRRREDLIGKHIWTEFPEGIGQPFYKAYYRAAEEQIAIELEEYYPPYGRWFENRIYPSKEGLTIFFRDITERKLGEERLRRSYEELRALAARMESVREEESSRIARELHDEVGQALTAIKIHLQTLQRHVGAPAVAGELSESIGMSERALEQVRNLSLDLRPSVLDDLGLAAALRWYLDRQALLSGFAAEFLADLGSGRLPRELETACFRVAQQALTNVAKHARARHVSVDLRREKMDLSLSIRDDGVGFDVAAARALARGGRSLGILGMEERVLLLGGSFEVRSDPSGGTQVSARFPLAPPPPAKTP